MGVIIDQFEVILDSQKSQSNGSVGSSKQEQTTKPALRPTDIASINDQLKNRYERVRAH